MAYRRHESATAAATGRTRSFREGDVLLREGGAPSPMLMLLSGLAVLTRRGRRIAVAGRGTILGACPALLGTTQPFTATAGRRGRVAAIPARELRQRLGEDDRLVEAIYRSLRAEETALEAQVQDEAFLQEIGGGGAEPTARRHRASMLLSNLAERVERASRQMETSALDGIWHPEEAAGGI